MKALLMALLGQRLGRCGLLSSPVQSVSGLRADGGIIPLYFPWLDESLRLLERAGYVKRAGDTLTTGARPVPAQSLLSRQWETKKKQWLSQPNLAAQMVLLDRTLEALQPILTGKIMATEVIFPDSSVSLVENIYKNNETADYFNRALARQTAALVKRHLAADPQAKVRLVEIGAGTGATSGAVLAALRDYRRNIEVYGYTDLSQAFLQHAGKHYAADNPFLQTAILNIEQPPDQQGFAVGTYDIAIAANVLHATRNIASSLRHAKQLLKAGGSLLLNEITLNNLFNHMTFGLLEGWWRYEDADLRLPGGPMLSPANWRRALQQSGFYGVTFPCDSAADLGQQIIAAQSDGLISCPSPLPAPQPPAAGKASGAAECRAAPDSAEIEERIRQVFAQSLQIDASRIDRLAPFSNYGLDSITAVNITRTLNALLDIDLDITIMFEMNTLQTLSAYIRQTFPVAAPVAEPPSCFDAGAAREADGLASASGGESAEDRGGAGEDECAVAIVGMAARFPDADDINEFWRNIVAGKNSVTRPPASRPEWPPRLADGRWGAFIDGVHDFDPAFFHLSLAEAEMMPPELRLMMMSVWHALEDAAITPMAFAGKETGVFIAAGPSDYGAITGQERTPSLLASPALSMLPNRLSWHFNLRGPSEYCETGCSSSLVALHRAIDAIRSGECRQAVVGAAHIMLSPRGFLGLEAAGMLSKNGISHPFQQQANGFSRGEGVASVILKPLSDARRDGDRIQAVIRGSAVAHGGKGVSYTAPNVQGMKTVIQRACARAGISPARLCWIEAHGISSSLADCAEINSFKAVMTETESENEPCFIGTLKPCIGNGEIVSGMAALIKTVMALRAQIRPPIPHFSRLNESIKLEGTRLRIATQEQPWPERRDRRRYAGIHSYGIGGVNAHLVISDAAPEERGDDGEPAAQNAGEQLIILSARNFERLTQWVRTLLARLEDAPAPRLDDLAWTLQVGREAMEARLAVRVDAVPALRQKLAKFLHDPENWREGVTSRSEVSNETLQQLFSVAGGDVLARELARAGQWTLLAKCWAAGANIDWRSIPRAASPRRIALPGYPFERQYCSGVLSVADAVSTGDAPAGAVSPAGVVSSAAPRLEDFRQLTAQMLGLASHELDVDLPLSHYGINSLPGLVLHQRFSRRWPDRTFAVIRPTLSLRDNVAPPKTVGSSSAPAADWPELVKLNDCTAGRAVFWIHGALGSVESYRHIARSCKRPFYAIQAKGFMTDCAPLQGVEQMAAYYTGVIRSIQPDGPYDVGGFCLGGIIGHEVVKQLCRQSQPVSSLLVIDAPHHTAFRRTAAAPENGVKNAALQVVNMLLWPASASNRRLQRTLIPASALDASLTDEAFILSLARLALTRGLAMSEEKLLAFIRQNIEIQRGYDFMRYELAPFPDIDGVECHYLYNSRNKFYGRLAKYFKVAGDPFSLDDVDYSAGWETLYPRFSRYSIAASSHMTVLSEKSSLQAIANICGAIYHRQQPETGDAPAAPVDDARCAEPSPITE